MNWTAGRVALITGASRGLGRAVALEWAARGANLLLCGRTETALRETAERARAVGAAQAEMVVCDVSNSAGVMTLFRACADHFGRLDVLFNNAGVGHFTPLALTSDELWSQTIDVNLRATFLCCREALPLFGSAGGGLVINNASVAAVRGFPNFAAYCAAKAGVLGLSRALREELRPQGIRVSVVMPGATDTPFWDNVQGEWNRAAMCREQDVARVIAALADVPPEMAVEELTIMPAGGAL